MNREEFLDQKAKMVASLNLGLAVEEPGFLPEMTEEQLDSLAGWLIGDGWEKS